jgi:hypothetical protein
MPRFRPKDVDEGLYCITRGLKDLGRVGVKVVL